MEDGPPKDEQASAARKRGPPFKNRNEPRKKNNRVSDIDRARIVDASRRGGNFKQLAATLGINVRTARSIAATDREVSLKTGGSVRKFGADVVAFVTRTVDENPTFTLKQIKRTVEEKMPGLTISTTSIDRLLDAHTYSVKLATQRPVDRNRSDVKSKRKEKFGRAKKGMAALQTTTSTKGANINIIACMSANGELHWRIVERVHWIVFNEFLADVSAQVDSEEPETEAVFIFDNAPAHNRAEQANLLGCKKTWHLLRHLLDPGNTKSAARNQLPKIIHQYPGTDAELLAELASRYINTSSLSDTHLPHYVGAPNEQLDSDISEAEVYAALHKLRTTSALGPDGVTNKALRNLDPKCMRALEKD
ncbi:hypothetical protein HPB49_016964 [Dermacentor silvarum]|uniref:Uncharacterized protein n=1 Tax=Dermacentor silvarum TaxID=543639 RepID=A0ACB8C4J1_DERSI|nr:hypothetical protein HPB49_016964 [Dermacentor silvarum]